jgi:hypothetical protein
MNAWKRIKEYPTLSTEKEKQISHHFQVNLKLITDYKIETVNSRSLIF